MTSKEPIQDFAAKLRVTALVLGCATQKALAAAFRAADPNTDFDLSRSYKWIQGRALPRSSKLYAEWAALLDTGASPRALASCSLEAFCAEVARRYGHSPAELLAYAHEGGQALAAPPRGPDEYLCGTYAYYVPAQSRHYAGQLVRGSLVIRPHDRPGERLCATFVQHFAGLRAEFVGPAWSAAHGLAMQLTNPAGTFAPVQIGVFRPTPPSSLLVGVVSSFVAIHSGSQPPYAARLVAVRVPGHADAPIEASNRYMPPTEEEIAFDLDGIGLPTEAAAELPRLMAAWLMARSDRAGGDQLSADDHTRLAELGDRLWIAATRKPALTSG
jgi:hypothetical protein